MSQGISSVPQPAAEVSPSRRDAPLPPLFLEQWWFVRLRWVAGAAVLAGGLLDRFSLHWFPGAPIPALGGAILLYNALLYGLLRGGLRVRWRARRLQALAWLQILLDLACLTSLTNWTGNFQSPLLGFYVFHMVFASLLLPRAMAFGAAALAVGMLGGVAYATAREPATREHAALAAGWALTLVATVYLANRITRSLRAQRRRLTIKNTRIRALARRIRRQQDALIQGEKMVAMGQLAAGVAHEVANPLASMDGLLQVIERKPDRATPDNIARLRDQIARVSTIVRQLTTFAHPDVGQWQEANLNDIVSHALDVLRFDRRLKRIGVKTTLDPNVPPLRLIPPAIEQIIVNLVINAVDAMEQSVDPQLAVRTIREPGAVRIEIEDNGTGIEPGLRTRIFEPFFTTKPVGKGTGLGLSISYQLVKKHGGHIDVTSTPGQGATFIIRLPAHTHDDHCDHRR